MIDHQIDTLLQTTRGCHASLVFLRGASRQALAAVPRASHCRILGLCRIPLKPQWPRVCAHEGFAEVRFSLLRKLQKLRSNRLGSCKLGPWAFFWDGGGPFGKASRPAPFQPKESLLLSGTIRSDFWKLHV